MKKLLFVLVFGLIFPLGVQAKEIKVAIFPFEIHAAQDLSYVREGIQDMLSTRLFVPNKVLVIDETKVKKALANLKEPLTEEKAREIGQNLGVDYVLFGSITTFGKRVSIDAKLVPVDELKSPVAIYTQTETLDDLIPKLAEFARRAVAYLEGRPMVAALPPQIQTNQEAAQKAPAQANNQKTYPAAATPKAYPKQPLPEKLYQPPSQAPSQQARLEKRRKYKYSEIDPWPDYPPEEEDYAVPEIQEQAKPKKEHKGHFWNRVWPLRWIFGRKEKEVVLKKEEITPPPPPPPPTQSTGATTQSSAQVESPPPAQSPPPSQTAPPSGGQTWQWY